MSFRTVCIVGSIFAGIALTSKADAASGWATGSVNLRVCPSTSCAKITAIPAGAQVWIFRCDSWCELDYAGRRGFASSRYIAFGGYEAAPRILPAPQIWWDFTPRYRSYEPRYRYHQPRYRDDRPRRREIPDTPRPPSPQPSPSPNCNPMDEYCQ